MVLIRTIFIGGKNVTLKAKGYQPKMVSLWAGLRLAIYRGIQMGAKTSCNINVSSLSQNATHIWWHFWWQTKRSTCQCQMQQSTAICTQRTMTRLTWLHCCLFRTNTISCSSFCLSKSLLSCRHTATALVSTKSTECLLEQVEGPVNGMQWNSSQRVSRLSYLHVMYCHATFWGLKAAC